MASSAAGWALLARLPDAERNYLLQGAGQNPQDNDARQIRLRSSEGMGAGAQGRRC